MEEPGERGPGKASGRGEGLADLADDLRLADHHCVEPGGDFEKVLHCRLSGVDLELFDETTAGWRKGRPHDGEHILQRTVEGVGLEVDLEPVAGVEHHMSEQRRIGVERRRHLFGDPGEFCEVVEGNKVVADTNGG